MTELLLLNQIMIECFIQNYRLLEINPNLPSVVFLNAQNVQTLKDIVGPLRQLGVPTAAVADIDIIKGNAVDWPQFLAAIQVPKTLHEGYRANRASIIGSFGVNNIDSNKKLSINTLGYNEKIAANHFFDSLNDYGMFVVRHGELEDWLPDMGIKSAKKRWTVDVLKALGDDPNSKKYVRPSDSDVWKFVSDIVAWIADPIRKGVQ
jgi:hypothetical protein